MSEQLLERMNIVIAGHVDHGKSTLVGRLLADTHSLPSGKIEKIRQSCAENGRVFEYSMLLDALEDEQKQGITIDSARVFFKSEKREYVLIDAPGHIEFLRNMLSGASRAAAAVLVIDALSGVAENSRRHGLLLSLLGIEQVIVLVNKLDRFDYDESVFRQIKNEYEAYLATLNVKPYAIVPVSAREGKNLTRRAEEMSWYQGKTVLELLDSFQNSVADHEAFFSMHLQDIYRFSNDNDDRRIYAGTVTSGTIRIGDPVRFLPSNKEAHIKSIESWNAPTKSQSSTDEATGLTLVEDIYVKSGEVMVKSDEPSPIIVTQRIEANIIWLGQQPLTFDRPYLLKLGSAKARVWLEKIERKLGEDSGAEDYYGLNRNECGCVILKFQDPMALTAFKDNPTLGRFVIVDGYNAAGGGIVLQGLTHPTEGERPDADFEDALFLLLRKHFPHRFPDLGNKNQDYTI
ncbi:MAG: 50S ribosome-binding GTPase [Burkholderiales bacterium]|jgi:bifunctional enzyme CysN/CysC/sulfate adenylyltransferase subunit 1|nr:50S ribosome-binding GTPase [Burkholderiales bacterium]